MADITLNSAVRSNLRTLQATTDLMNRTENRLSTGKKVNSALDNPSSFFTAQALDRRASDLTGLLDSVSSSVKTLEAADNGIKAITDVVESLKATARSALQSQAAVTDRASISSVAIDGLTAGNLLGFNTADADPVDPGEPAEATPAQAVGTEEGLTNATTLDSLGFEDGDEFEITVGAETFSYTVTDAAAEDLEALITDIQGQIDAGDTEATIELTADGALSVTAGNNEDTITFANTTAAALTGLGVETTAYEPTPAEDAGGAGGATAATAVGTEEGLTGATTLDTLGFEDGDELEITIGAETFTYTVTDAAAEDLDALMTDIQGQIDAGDTEATIELTADGALSVTAGNTEDTITFANTTAAALTGLGLETTAYEPTPAEDDGEGEAEASPLSGTTLSFVNADGDTKTVTFSATAGADNVDTLEKLNDWLETNNVNLQASVSGRGANATLKLQTSNASASLAPDALTGTAIGADSAFAAGTFSEVKTGGDGLTKREGFLQDYNDALEQISSLAKDASFNGVNLLNGDDLDIVFNEDGSSKLNVKGTEFNFEGLGLRSLSVDDFLDSDKINAVIDEIEGAFSTLEAQASKFGSQLQIVETRESFTKDMVGTLEDGALALVGADTNAEAANLATLQTRQALIVSSLSISTQQESNVLQLLR